MPVNGHVGFPLVGGLVVAIGDVGFFDLLARRDAAVDQVVAGAERDRRHAALGEREVVGAEEVAGFGLRIRRSTSGSTAWRSSISWSSRSSLALPEVLKSRAGPVRVERVHVDHADRRAQRIQRLGRVVLGAQQALLLGGDGEEHHASARAWSSPARTRGRARSAPRCRSRCRPRRCRCGRPWRPAGRRRGGPSARCRSPFRPGACCRRGGRRCSAR